MLRPHRGGLDPAGEPDPYRSGPYPDAHEDLFPEKSVFGQSGSRYETQLKTSTGTPALQSPASSLSLGLTHVVYTRTSAGQAVCYINGVQVSTLTTTGTFATWGTDHKLILSDNWQGSYFLVAVYGRALTGTEVQQNYLAGANAN